MEFYGGPMEPCGALTLPSLKVDRNPKTVIAISQPFSMIFEFRIDESNRVFKSFQMVLTIMARIAKIGPRSSKIPPRPDLLSERGV